MVETMINSLTSNSFFSSYSSTLRTNVSINQSSTSKASTNEVLGYKVDKDGYFTEEFNKVAGIPSDYKIHSSTMQNLVRTTANPDKFLKEFKSVDIAKTAGNAYKVLSQVVGEEVLNSKDSFSLDEIAKFPQGYEYNRQSMWVSKIYNTSFDYDDASLEFDYQNDTGTKINTLFFNSSENIAKGNPATNIFSNNNDAKQSSDFGVFFNPNGDKYTKSDGSITKGGLLVAVINANSHTKEGEVTMWGKMQGFDKNVSSQEMNNFKQLLGFGSGSLELVVDTQGYFSLMTETDTETFKKKYAEFVKSNNEALQKLKEENEEFLKNYKDPISQMFEEIKKKQEEAIERLQEKKREERIKTRKINIEA